MTIKTTMLLGRHYDLIINSVKKKCNHDFLALARMKFKEMVRRTSPLTARIPVWFNIVFGKFQR